MSAGPVNDNRVTQSSLGTVASKGIIQYFFMRSIGIWIPSVRSNGWKEICHGVFLRENKMKPCMHVQTCMQNVFPKTLRPTCYIRPLSIRRSKVSVLLSKFNTRIENVARKHPRNNYRDPSDATENNVRWEKISLRLGPV